MKVIILGQDPYFKPNQANGLCFSVESNTSIPKSLNNIYKELKDDLGVKRTNGNLFDWAQQGVLLLNSILTVENNKSGSHKDFG
jgi:uracil-DNA glycosylase